MLLNINPPSNRVLVADDDPVIRHLVTTIVTKEGYTVVVANDGNEAYRHLQRDADFTAAVFDMMMPGLKGLDLLRYMRTEKRLSRIPVLMITSHKDLTIMADLFAAGATAILRKPFSTVQIQAMFQMIIGQRRPNSDDFSQKLTMGQHRSVGI